MATSSPAVEEQLPATRHFWAASFAILAVAALLRIPSLGYESLWVDEFITHRLSQVSLPSLPLAVAEADSQPPLFYLLVKATRALGTNEITLRLVSVLAGLATIPAIGWIAKQLSGSRAALIAMAILTVSPFHVWYSQEGRAYALVLFLLTLSVGFLFRAGGRSKTWPLAWVGFVSATSLALYTHLMALPFLLVQLPMAIWAGRRIDTERLGPREPTEPAGVDWRRILLGQLVALLIFLPGAVLLFQHAWLHYLLPPTSVFLEGPTTTYTFSPGGIASLGVAAGYGLFTLLGGFSLGPSVRELHALSGSTLEGLFTPGVAVFCVLVGIVASFALRATRRGSPLSEAGFLWTMVVFLAIPIAVFFAEAPFRPRYVAIALPGVVLWLAGGITSLGSPVKRISTTFVLLAAFVIPLTQRHASRYVKDDVRSAASYLLGTGTAETNVVLSSRSMVEGLSFYFEKGSAAKTFEIRPYPGSGVVETEDQAVEELGASLSESEPAWLLLGRIWDSDPETLVLSAAQNRYDIQERGAWPGVRLILLTPRTFRP